MNMYIPKVGDKVEINFAHGSRPIVIEISQFLIDNIIDMNCGPKELLLNSMRKI